MRSPSLILTFGLVLAGAPSLAGTLEEEAAELRAGVPALPKVGVPGPLSLLSERCAAVVLGAMGGGRVAPMVALGRHGEGRFVAYGHGGYLGAGGLGAEGGAALMENNLRWLTRGRPQATLAMRGSPKLADFARALGYRVRALGRAEALDGVDAVCLLPDGRIGPSGFDRLRAFVAGGGGLLVGQLGWGWQQLNPKASLTDDHPGNRLMAPLGLVWGDGYVDAPLAPGKPSPRAYAEVNAARALEQLGSGSELSKRRRARLSGAIEGAIRAAPMDHPLRARLRKLVERAERRWPSSKSPLGADQALARLALLLEHRAALEAPIAELVAAPSAADFPGAVPSSAPRGSHRRSLDLGPSGWKSTGLYAAPGERVVVVVPDTAGARRLSVRIGAHTDRLWNKGAWRRHPEVSRSFALTGARTELGSAHGGLIYVVGPPAPGERIEVIFEGVIEAPRFVLGRDDNAKWISELRARPGPWAELETAKIILTVPAAAVRSLADPEALMKSWDRVLDCYAELGARELPERPERITADRQIALGYMHSGYPIMTHLDAVARMVDEPAIVGHPKASIWGLWHELGHNHQQGPWTFSGTVEVTCNLFTLYVLNTISGLRPAAHERMIKTRPRALAHIAAGAPFERWCEDPFLALYMYIQVQDAFSWAVFKRAFAAYRASPRASLPRSNAAKRDRWLVELSRATGRDLGRFFDLWGVPVSKEAKRAVARWPAWLPAELAELEQKRKP